MFRNNDKINTRELVFFFLASAIEVGTLTSARNVAIAVGPDAWLSEILKFVFVSFTVFIILKLGQRFYKHGFVDFSRKIVGRFPSLILSASLVIYWLFVCARVIGSIINVVSLTMLDTTPSLAVSIPILLLTLYICWHGIEPLCRMSIIIVLVILPLIILTELTIAGRFSFDNFLPFLAEGPLPVIKQSIIRIADEEETTFFLFLIPFMNKPEKAIKGAALSIFVLFIYGFFTVWLPIGVLGTDLVKQQLMPTVTALEVGEIPGAFIERLGTLYIGFWIIIAFPTIPGLVFAISLTTSQIFNLKSYKPFIIPVLIIALIISYIPKNMAEYETFFKFLDYYGFFVILIIPLLLYIIALIRKLKDE
jgi:spore germination protein